MSIERTLSILKPDAVAKNVIGQIYSRLEDAELQIIAAKMLHLSRQQAEAFYAIHRGRPFFNELVTYMHSGPILVQVLEGNNAIENHRKIMGATNPTDADAGTIRADFAENVTENAVHGSDTLDTANHEIAFFFSNEEIHLRTR